MAKESDIALKLLANVHPADWVVLAGLILLTSAARVTAVDAGLSSLGREADKLLRVDDGPRSYLVHFEFQTTADTTLDERVLVYNVMARQRYRLPVVSVVVLLHPAADSPRITGRVVERHADDAGLEFKYRTVRVWELPCEPLLSGPIGTLPLAALSDVAPGELPAVVARLRQRLADEPAEARPADVWDATKWLLLARYPHGFTEANMMLTLADLEQTWAYKEIIQKGRAEGLAEGLAVGRADGLRQTLLRLGATKFGKPSRATEARVAAATDPVELDRLTLRLLTADSWDAVFDVG